MWGYVVGTHPEGGGNTGGASVPPPLFHLGLFNVTLAIDAIVNFNIFFFSPPTFDLLSPPESK